MFRRLLRRGRLTEFGDRYDLRHIRSVEQFQSQVETFDYETFKPYVERMMEGVRSVAYPGRVSVVRPFVGHHLGPEQIPPRDRWSRCGGIIRVGMRDVATVYVGQLSEVAGFRGQDPDARAARAADEGRNRGGGPLGAADPARRRFGAAGSGPRGRETAIIGRISTRRSSAICRECASANG